MRGKDKAFIPDDNGYAPPNNDQIIAAVKGGDVVAVETFLREDLDKGKADQRIIKYAIDGENGNTMLHAAVAANKPEVVEAIMRYGGNEFKTTNNDGVTAMGLCLALKKEAEQQVKELKDDPTKEAELKKWEGLKDNYTKMQREIHDKMPVEGMGKEREVKKEQIKNKKVIAAVLKTAADESVSKMINSRISEISTIAAGVEGEAGVKKIEPDPKKAIDAFKQLKDQNSAEINSNKELSDKFDEEYGKACSAYFGQIGVQSRTDPAGAKEKLNQFARENMGKLDLNTRTELTRQNDILRSRASSTGSLSTSATVNDALAKTSASAPQLSGHNQQNDDNTKQLAAFYKEMNGIIKSNDSVDQRKIALAKLVAANADLVKQNTNLLTITKHAADTLTPQPVAAPARKERSGSTAAPKKFGFGRKQEGSASNSALNTPTSSPQVPRKEASSNPPLQAPQAAAPTAATPTQPTAAAAPPSKRK